MSTPTPTPKPPPPTTTTSVQLPDLLACIQPFELRTNKHCRTVSRTSEAWLVERGVRFRVWWDHADDGELGEGEGEAEAREWQWDKDVKLGLLASACYPSADATPLKLGADFLGVLFCDRAVCVEEGEGFALLNDRLSRMAYKNPAWYIRFLASHRAYQSAKRRLYHPESDTRLDVESYIKVRRDVSGFRMAFDMIECVGDVVLREEVWEDGGLKRVRDRACDVVCWAEDIVSCARGISPTSPQNLVTTLMRERNVPLEGALVLAGGLVQQSVDAFLEGERALFAGAHGGGEDVRRYVRGVRDWVAGFVNWLYESRVYFGDKGMEVRMFGWVFVPVEL